MKLILMFVLVLTSCNKGDVASDSEQLKIMQLKEITELNYIQLEKNQLWDKLPVEDRGHDFMTVCLRLEELVKSKGLSEDEIYVDFTCKGSNVIKIVFDDNEYESEAIKIAEEVHREFPKYGFLLLPFERLSNGGDFMFIVNSIKYLVTRSS